MAASIVVAVVVLTAAGVATAHALQGSPTAAYRTAVVTTSSVTATLQRAGTIEPVAQASVSFPMSGSVATVAVSPGQTVTTGQTLASLSTTSLQANLTSKQATLAAAQLVVSQAETAQSSATSDPPATTTATTADPPSTTQASGSSSSGGTSSSGKISGGTSTTSAATTLQQASAVTQAQQQVDQGLQQAQVAVQNVTATCATTSDVGSSSPSSSASSSPSPSSSASSLAAQIEAQANAAVAAARGSQSTATTVPATSASGGGAGTNGCSAAISSALVTQENLASAETALAQAETTLQGTLDKAASSSASSAASNASTASSAATTSSKSAGSASTSPTTSSGRGSTGISAGTGGATQSASSIPTAADLVADQATVDADAAQVSVAQQNIAEATIVSPIDGTVVQVGLSVGQQASANSATDAIIIVGQGGWEVGTTIPVASLNVVAVGDNTTIAPDGTAKTYSGKVVEIGVAPTSSSSSNYSVVVGFTSSPSDLGNGASATVTIDTAHATQALTVPTSAIHAAGGLHFVSTLSHGKLTNTPISIGPMGADQTVVASGLQAGDVVVLANFNAAIPSSNTASLARGALSAVGGGGVVRVVGPAGG
ncbi:MAG: biotin/lipoyl-binding protein [Acidimicrobiales bacterium]